MRWDLALAHDYIQNAPLAALQINMQAQVKQLFRLQLKVLTGKCSEICDPAIRNDA